MDNSNVFENDYSVVHFNLASHLGEIRICENDLVLPSIERNITISISVKIMQIN